MSILGPGPLGFRRGDAIVPTIIGFIRQDPGIPQPFEDVIIFTTAPIDLAVEAEALGLPFDAEPLGVFTTVPVAQFLAVAIALGLEADAKAAIDAAGQTVDLTALHVANMPTRAVDVDLDTEALGTFQSEAQDVDLEGPP